MASIKAVGFACRVRLFIGVPLPPDPRLTRVTHAIQDAVPDARPVPAGTWHVTLRFLGEVADPHPVQDALHTVCAGVPAMPVEVRGLGAFQDPRKARILWAKVHAPGLRELAAAISDATKDLGEPPKESFVAHATLARLRRPQDVGALLDAHHEMPLARGVLDAVVLYRSVLGPGGPSYERLTEAPLSEAP